MNFEKINNTPFKEPPEQRNFDSETDKIKMLKSQPDKLVREYELHKTDNEDEIIEIYAEGEKLFNKLSNDYDIKVVSMNHIMGKNEQGKTALFTVVDKIEGEVLSKIENLPAETKGKLNELYYSLGQHCYDAWRENSKYWADANNSQFIYGRKPGEKENNFYLSDVGPKFFRHGENKLFPVVWPIHNISKGIVEAENKLKPKIYLDKARNKLLLIISEMQKEMPDNKWLLEAKDLLEKH